MGSGMDIMRHAHSQPIFSFQLDRPSLSGVRTRTLTATNCSSDGDTVPADGLIGAATFDDSIITEFCDWHTVIWLLKILKMEYMKHLSLFQHLLKAKRKNRGRLLGLDVGDKYVGLAVSDIHNIIASPLSVLVRKKTNIDLMATDFQSLISELSLDGFIVGFPYDRMQTSSNAIQVKVFLDDLSKTGKLDGVKYTFWSESYTSKNVELLLKPLNIPPVLSKTINDKFSAVQILQGYLDYMNKNAKLD